MGDNLHQNPSDFETLFDASDPSAFYNSLAFTDLITNIVTADSIYQSLPQGCCLIPGEANNDCEINISDAYFLVQYIFRDGSSPSCCDRADADGGGETNIGDVLFMVNYIFQNGAAPRCPSPGELLCL